MHGAVSAEATAARGVWPIVTHEFIVAISNPKALLLFAALLPQFTSGPPGAATRPSPDVPEGTHGR
jgi:threonine/homoserine/homoserine lactone efflux protein